MKITLDIPDGIIAGFFNGVEVTAHGMQLVSYQLSTDDLKDGNTVKLPREQEWRIKLVTHLLPEEISVSNATGCTDWSESIKTARIEIINPACYGDRIVPFNFEKTLVHELLHLKFSFWCQDEYSVADRLMHQYIDDLARALTEGDSDDEA